MEQFFMLPHRFSDRTRMNNALPVFFTGRYSFREKNYKK